MNLAEKIKLLLFKKEVVVDAYSRDLKAVEKMEKLFATCTSFRGSDYHETVRTLTDRKKQLLFNRSEKSKIFVFTNNLRTK